MRKINLPPTLHLRVHGQLSTQRLILIGARGVATSLETYPPPRERGANTYSPPLSGPFAIKRPVSCVCEGEEENKRSVFSAFAWNTSKSLRLRLSTKVILCNPYLVCSHALVYDVHVKKWNLPGDLHKFVTRVYCSIQLQ